VNNFEDERRPEAQGRDETAEAGADVSAGNPADEEVAESSSEFQATPEPKAPPTPEELADLRARAAERDEYLDLLKRARADFANYQKRIAEDRRKWGAAAQRDLLARLMGAADHCRLSAEKSKEDNSAESLRDCIGLIWAELEKFLDSSGVKFVSTRGEPFDPHRHEAVFMQEREDLPDATVIDEIRPGYEFDGQVIRPAQVVVSKKPKPPEPETVNEVSEASDRMEPDGAAPGETPADEASPGESEEGPEYAGG